MTKYIPSAVVLFTNWHACVKRHNQYPKHLYSFILFNSNTLLLIVEIVIKTYSDICYSNISPMNLDNIVQKIEGYCKITAADNY